LLARARRLPHDHRTRAKKGGAQDNRAAQEAAYHRWQRRQRAQDNRAAQEAKAARKAARQEINAGNEGLKLVPVGTQIFLERQPDGSWQGALLAEGIMVEHNRADHRGLLHRLSVLWRKERFARSPRIVGG
jgi:hypothetical protein